MASWMAIVPHLVRRVAQMSQEITNETPSQIKTNKYISKISKHIDMRPNAR